jgi:hypothetical protein
MNRKDFIALFGRDASLKISGVSAGILDSLSLLLSVSMPEDIIDDKNFQEIRGRFSYYLIDSLVEVHVAKDALKIFTNLVDKHIIFI